MRYGPAKGQGILSRVVGDLYRLGEGDEDAMGFLRDRLYELNRSTESNWRPYRTHRETVMRILSDVATAGRGTVCLLGAGNCNDIDLQQLTARYDRIHLVDLDEVALRSAIERQLGDHSHLRTRVVIHETLDISGVLDMLGAQTDAALVARTAGSVRVPIEGGPFDVVASLCVVTQLIDAAVTALAANDPNLDAAMLAIRNAHLSTLGELVKPEGRVVFVTDFVSSDTAPDILDAGSRPMEQMKRLLVERNFISGTNPIAVEEACRSQLGAPLEVERFEKPWIWNLGTRAYLAYALVLRRSEAGGRPRPIR